MSTPRYTVSSLTNAIRHMLESTFSTLSVEGELGRITRHRSGHWYLVLKDGDAVLNAVMFRGANRSIRWEPNPGDRVLATGVLDVYAPSGRYNMIIRQMVRAGEGDLLARLEALKKKLQAEGLFEQARKRPLPPLPRAVGVATSPTGAALHDIMRVVGQRFPGFPLILSPCRVQGEGAPEEIVVAIKRIERHGVADVIIVGRGGGSAEDLAAFNDEGVVRAVHGASVPVVSAVGHEVDVSLADLAADVRAATPSHAAELVVPEMWALAELLSERRERIARSMARRIAEQRARLDRLRPRDPRKRLEEARIRCDELDSRLRKAGRRRVVEQRACLGGLEGRLRALSPLQVLERGYAIAMVDGRAVRSAGELVTDDLLQVRFARGSAEARVTSLSSEENPEPGERGS